MKLNKNIIFNYIKHIQIIKPNIIIGNVISLIGGFLLASKGNINLILFFYTLIGVICIISSACIINNIIDHDIDFLMKRTKNRILVKKKYLIKKYFIFSIILFIIGFFILYFKVNNISLFISILGFLIYVFLYSLYTKRKYIYSIFLGSLSGATPPIIGYCSVSNKFDNLSKILIIIFIIWQIPHFYSIAIFRSNDYKLAKIPTFPEKYGIFISRNHIIFYIINFIIFFSMLTFLGFTGYKYLIIEFFISLYWLYIAVKEYKNNKNIKYWAKKLFIYSIIVITFFSILISLDYIS